MRFDAVLRHLGQCVHTKKNFRLTLISLKSPMKVERFSNEISLSLHTITFICVDFEFIVMMMKPLSMFCMLMGHFVLSGVAPAVWVSPSW